MIDETTENPIIQRLKQFMAQTGLTSTQFADKASIPRPTLSQMLHGRNKSINNQVLAKLDENFPELDIVWLLFGRGDMLVNGNIKSSERQNALFFDEPKGQAPENDTVNDEPDVTYGIKAKLHKEIGSAKDDLPSSDGPGWAASVLCSPPEEAIRNATKSVSTEAGKRISSIIVLYTDNSFETFTPSSEA